MGNLRGRPSGRPLPQLSQQPSQGQPGISVQPADPNAPPTYASVWRQFRLILQRLGQLEFSVDALSTGSVASTTITVVGAYSFTTTAGNAYLFYSQAPGGGTQNSSAGKSTGGAGAGEFVKGILIASGASITGSLGATGAAAAGGNNTI